MFDVEKAVAEWRRQMVASGIKTPMPLDELECHLRDELERLGRKSVLTQQAFEAATQRVGRPDVLRNEFRKNERNVMTWTVTILTSLFGTLFGGALILPALALWQRRGIFHPGPLLIGSAIVLISAGLIIYGLATHRASLRKGLVTTFMVFAGLFYLVPLIQAPFVAQPTAADWMACIILGATSILFYGSCVFLMWRRSHSPLREI